jgi:uncharacterized protein YukE
MVRGWAAIRAVHCGGPAGWWAASTAAAQPELVASWSRRIGVLAEGLVEHAAALCAAAAEYRAADTAAAAVIDESGW